MQPNQCAIQIHRDSIHAVMATPQRNRLEEYVVPGSEFHHSQMFFAHSTKEEVELVAGTHGSAPYFAIRPMTWYQGDGIKSMHRAFVAFIKKSFKAVWAPFMYHTLVAMFWCSNGLFGDKSMIRMQILGPSKMLVGFSESGWEVLQKQHVQLALTVGLSFKDIASGEFHSADDNKRPLLLEHRNKGKVSNVFAIHVPPWWKQADMSVVFAMCTKNHEKVIDRMQFSVGEMRMVTWRIYGADLALLVGMVFHGVSGKDTLSIIAESKYIAKKNLVSATIKAWPQNGPLSKLITTKEMGDAMSLDSEVRTVLKRMKRRHCGHGNGKAASSNGA